jgi:hypothetical protein
MNSSVQFNLDSSQFAANVFSNTGAPVSPIRRPLRKAAPYSRLSPIPSSSTSTTDSDIHSSSKDDGLSQPFSPSLASPVARRELAPILSAIDKQSEQQSSAPPYFDSLSSASVNEALVNAIARIVNSRMAIEVEIREGLAREVGRMRDSVYNSEKLAKRFMDENMELKETILSMQEDIKMIAESSRTARAEAVAATSNVQGSSNATARAVAVMASDMASLKKEIQEDFYNVKTSQTSNTARLENFQRVFESKLSTLTVPSMTSQDFGEKENAEASRRASDSAIKSLSMLVKDLHLQVTTAQEELKKMSSTLASEGLIVPESGQKQNPGGKLQRGNDNGFSPQSNSRKARFNSLKQGNDVDEALGVTDSDHDPSLWSNRVITRALLETYLSGIRSSLEQEAQQRRRELSVVEADYTSKLDKLISEVGGFRAFVRDEAKTRVDAVVEAMTSAISELSNTARSHSSNLAQMQAAFQEEKAWVRENATLVRDTVTARFAGIEQAVRVQARSRVATEQAIGDALLKGLQHEQKAREEGINSAMMKFQDISRSLDILRERFEHAGVQEELNNLNNVVRTVEQRGLRLEEDAQQSFNALEDRNRKLEADLQSVAAAFNERIDKLDKETLTTQLLAKRAEERSIAEGRSATESRHALELSMKIGSQAAAERAEAIEKEARSVNHLLESRFSRIESLIRDAAVAQAAEASALKAASLAMAEEEERQRNSALKITFDEAESNRKQGESSVKLSMRQATREIEAKLEARLAAWGDAKEQDIGTWQEGLSAEVAGGISKLEGDIKRQTIQINKRIADLAAAVNATRKASGLLIPDIIHEDIVPEPITKSSAVHSSTEKVVDNLQMNGVSFPSSPADAPARSELARAESAEAMPSEVMPSEAEAEKPEPVDTELQVNQFELEGKAATKIQAVQKGRIVRKEMSKSKIVPDDVEDLKIELSKTEAAFDSTFKALGGEDAEEKIALVISESEKMIHTEEGSSDALMMSEEVYNEEHAKAATKIQAVQRGNAVRRVKNRELKGQAVEEKLVENVTETIQAENGASAPPNSESDEQAMDAAPEGMQQELKEDAAPEVMQQELKEDAAPEVMQQELKEGAAPEAMQQELKEGAAPEAMQQELKEDAAHETKDEDVNSEESIAATKIQAVVKGRAVRKDLNAQRRADEIEKLGNSVVEASDDV